MNEQSCHRLTERQKDCLRLVAHGYTSKEIGRKLELSPSTVDNHILASTQILEAPSRAVAARLLASTEIRQKLPSQTATLADTRIDDANSITANVSEFGYLKRVLLLLPPLGGLNNELSPSDRTLRIVQVAAISFGTVMSIILFVAGAFKLLS
jgi:DNA-binding CsgD family transcriptional regulator